MKLNNLTINSILVALLLAVVGCNSSSPTGPGPAGGGSTGTGTFSGPQGYLEVSGSSVFGSRFEPDGVQISEIGVARVAQFVFDDESVVGVAFNVQRMVTKVGAVHANPNENWNLDAGIGVPVSGVTVIPDGDAWILQFNHVELPGALGTSSTLTLYGELRTDL